MYWQLGQQGLGAEILAAAYMAAWAASQKRGFYLDSSKWNFLYLKGWQDYFHPALSELRLAKCLGIFDINKPNLLKTRLQKAVLRAISCNRLFCPIEEFWKIWNRKSSEEKVKPFFVLNRRFEQLGEAASEIVREALIPWHGVMEEAHVRFPAPQMVYDAAVFLRGGDKEKEISQPHVGITIKRLSRLIKAGGNVFIASDDYQKVKQIQNTLRGVNTFTLCSSVQSGHQQQRFNLLPAQHRKKEILRYLQEIQVMQSARHFIGPFSSNFSRLIYILRKGKRCHTTDKPFSFPTPF